MHITINDYKKYFVGFQIIDCVVRRHNIFYFVVKEMYDTRKSPPSEFALTKKVIPYFTDTPPCRNP
jgi:hypothetical protein